MDEMVTITIPKAALMQAMEAITAVQALLDAAISSTAQQSAGRQMPPMNAGMTPEQAAMQQEIDAGQ